MGNNFKRNPNNHGDIGVYHDYVIEQMRRSLGSYSCKLYSDSGTLKVSVGGIGISDGTNEGTCIVDTVMTVDLAACEVSSWAKIEVEVTGATAFTITASDSTAGTNAAALPSEFTGAYNGAKGGFYIDATKRCIGLAWKNASGTLEGIVNCLPLIDGWIGYCQSDDANDYPYVFEKRTQIISNGTPHNAFNSINFSNIKEVIYIDSLGAESTKRIKTKIIEIGDWNMDATSSITIAHGISDRKKIRNIKIHVFGDIGSADETNVYDLTIFNGALHGGYYYINGNNIILSRVTSGVFDGTNFDATSFNRGHMKIEYEE